MNDYINFSNNNNNDNSIINNEKINTTRPIMIFSLKNISTAYNSYVSNDYQNSKINKINNNKLPRKINLSDFFPKKNNKMVFKTSNNYYRRKNYQKFLNIPQSASSSSYGDTNNNSYFKKNSYNTYNKINNNRNLNSNLEEKKIYNKLNIKELIEINKKRKKIIEQKKKEEEIKKENLLKEEEKLSKIIIGTENCTGGNLNNICDEGVQTSIKIKENKNNEQNMNENGKYEDKKEENKINDLNFYNNNNINKNNINNNNYGKLKESKSTDIDLVNIGNETQEIINNDNSNKNISDINNTNNDLNFNIENNDTLVSNIKKNDIEDTLSFEKTFKNKDNKEKNINEQKEIIDFNIENNDENLSKSSSNKDDEVTEVEEYDINKVNLQNETKSIVSDFFNNKESTENNIELQLSQNKHIFSLGKNRYDYLDSKEYKSFSNNSVEKSFKITNDISNNIKSKNISISKSSNKIIFNNDNILKNSEKLKIRKKLNSCTGRLNKSINKEKIIINNKIDISSNIKGKEKYLNTKNNKSNTNINFKTDGFRRRNSGSINKKIINEYTNKNISNSKIDKKCKIIILPTKSNNNIEDNKKLNKTKKKRQLDNYAEYYKLRSNSKEIPSNKENIE